MCGSSSIFTARSGKTRIFWCALLETPFQKDTNKATTAPRTARGRRRRRAGGHASNEILFAPPGKYAAVDATLAHRKAQAATNQPATTTYTRTHNHCTVYPCVIRPRLSALTHSALRQTDDRPTYCPSATLARASSVFSISCDLVFPPETVQLQARYVTLHATIGSRPWPALGVALIKRTIVPIFSRRRRAYAEPFRSARPAATGACGRRAPRGHHHTCSGCAVGW